MTQSSGHTTLTELKPKNGRPRFALLSLYCFESLGVRYIASALINAGYACMEVYYEDYKRNTFAYPTQADLDGLTNLLKENEVDLVGISVRSSYRKLAGIITRHIHDTLGVPVVWGSNHATICPEDSLKDADALIRGEAEVAIVEMMDAIRHGKDLTRIRGLWLKMPDGAIVQNGMAPYVDVDSIDDPIYEGDGKHYYKDGGWHRGDPQFYENSFCVISSRGCPHLCSYCSNKFYLEADKGYLRLRTVDKLIEEIVRAKEKMPNLGRVYFFDDLFSTNKKWTDEFVEKYPVKVGLPFMTALNPQNISRSVVDKLKRAGASALAMGIESGSERVANELYGRRVSNEKVMESIHILHESGLKIYYDILIDNPLETSQDKRDSFEFLLQIPRPYSFFLYSLAYLPGTPLTDRLLKEGLIAEDEVEGNRDYSIYQWNVSLTFERSVEDRFWAALLSLITKDFVPKGLIRWLSYRKVLMRHPKPLIMFAWVTNVVKIALLAFNMYREGVLTWQEIRRHGNLKQLAVR